MLPRALIVLALLAALPAGAEPISTDRPTTTFAATTLPASTVQVESGFAFGFMDAGGLEGTAQALSMNVRAGLTERLELRLDLVPWARSSFSFLGMGGTESQLFPVLAPGVKFGLVEGDFSAALVGSLVIATGDSVETAGMAALALSKRAGSATLFGGLATTLDDSLALTGSAGLSVPLGTLSPFAEVQVRTNGDDALLSSTFGFVVAASETVQADVSATFGPDIGEFDVYSFGAGVSFRLPE